MTRLAVLVLITLSAVSVIAVSVGQSEPTVNVEVTVWQRVEDGSLYLSTRPQGGSWVTHSQPLDMSRLSSSGRFRQGSSITVAVPIPETPPATTEPEPSATALPDRRLSFRFWTTTTETRVLQMSVDSDHDIGRYDLQLGINGTFGSYSVLPILAGETYTFPGGPLSRWEDVEQVDVRTRSRSQVSLWECDKVENRHAIDGRFDCVISALSELPDLTEADDPSLWMYLRFERGLLRAYARAGVADLGSVFVSVKRACSRYQTYHHKLVEDGQVLEVDCVARLSTWVEGQVDEMVVLTSGLGWMYCQHHVDSTEEQSVWACGPW